MTTAIAIVLMFIVVSVAVVERLGLVERIVAILTRVRIACMLE
jgi:hypothetical protein